MGSGSSCCRPMTRKHWSLRFGGPVSTRRRGPPDWVRGCAGRPHRSNPHCGCDGARGVCPRLQHDPAGSSGPPGSGHHRSARRSGGAGELQQQPGPIAEQQRRLGVVRLGSERAAFAVPVLSEEDLQIGQHHMDERVDDGVVCGRTFGCTLEPGPESVLDIRAGAGGAGSTEARPQSRSASFCQGPEPVAWIRREPSAARADSRSSSGGKALTRKRCVPRRSRAVAVAAAASSRP